MIIVVKKNCDEKQLDNLIKWVKSQGLGVDVSQGEHSTVLGLIGDTPKVDIDLVRSMDIVENVKRIQEPYKSANRKYCSFQEIPARNEARFNMRCNIACFSSRNRSTSSFAI